MFDSCMSMRRVWIGLFVGLDRNFSDLTSLSTSLNKGSSGQRRTLANCSSSVSFSCRSSGGIFVNTSNEAVDVLEKAPVALMSARRCTASSAALLADEPHHTI